jgi:hypothetical protein
VRQFAHSLEIRQTWDAMRRFRIFLTLLLCLTVPVAGWASVLSGPLCPQLHQHGAPEISTHDQVDLHPAAVAASEGEHHHEHCGDVSNHGTPCKGDHCECGCGFGTCSFTSVLLLASPSTAFAVDLGTQAVPHADQSFLAGVRNNSPLRPPIS